MKKTWLKVSVIFFSADFNPIDTNDILDIHRYFMEEHNVCNYWKNNHCIIR